MDERGQVGMVGNTADVVVLRPSRRRGVLMLVGSLVMASAAFLPNADAVVRWGAGGFFGLCALVFVFGLLPGANELRLDHEWMTVRSLYRSHRVARTDIDRFTPAWQTVGYVFLPGRTPALVQRMQGFNITGVDGLLPDTYGMTRVDLTNHLNQWLSRPAPPPPSGGAQDVHPVRRPGEDDVEDTHPAG